MLSSLLSDFWLPHRGLSHLYHRLPHLGNQLWQQLPGVSALDHTQPCRHRALNIFLLRHYTQHGRAYLPLRHVRKISSPFCALEILLSPFKIVAVCILVIIYSITVC